MSVRSQPESIRAPITARVAESIQINFEYLFSDLLALETQYESDVRGVTLGGTGLALYAVGDLLTASGTTTLARLADVAAGSYLRSGGVTTVPLWSTLVLPNAATAGDTVVATASNTWGAVTAGAAGKLYQAAGAGTVPAWTTATYPSVGTATASYLRADGTNWIASTLKLPNSVTSGRVVFASAADTYGEDADLTFSTDTLTATKIVGTTNITTPTLYGSAADNGDLTLEGTSSATKTTSYVILQPTGGNVIIGATPSFPDTSGLSVNKTISGSTFVFGATIEGTYTSSTNHAFATWMNPTLVPANNKEAFFLHSGGNVAPAVGTITVKAYGAYVAALGNTGAGSVTTVYGLYLAPQTIGTTDYTLYSESGTNYLGGNTGVGTLLPAAKLAINGGLHVGGDTDPGDNNALVDGTLTATGAFGCNTKTAQTAYASGGALAAYGAGANGFDSGANASALHALVVAIRAALVANGIMS